MRRLLSITLVLLPKCVTETWNKLFFLQLNNAKWQLNYFLYGINYFIKGKTIATCSKSRFYLFEKQVFIRLKAMHINCNFRLIISTLKQIVMHEFNFGENLRIIRQAKGISQEVMAIGLNMSQSKYSKLERNPFVPDVDLLEKISKLLEVESLVLLSGRAIEDLVPKIGFEQNMQEIMNTRIGQVFFWMLLIPYINAVYDLADGFARLNIPNEMAHRVVRFIAGISAIVFAYYWMRQMQKGKK